MTCADCEVCPLESPGAPEQIHITVASCDQTRFQESCTKVGIKGLVIHNMSPSGNWVPEMITSSSLTGLSAKAETEVARISEQLLSRRFRILRKKIEAAPDHPEAPRANNNKRLRLGQYFESHISVLTESDEQLKLLMQVAARDSLFLSRNALKWATGNYKKTMATLRVRRGTVDTFRDRVNESIRHLRGHGLSVDKAIIEFSRYDSNEGLDASWMKMEGIRGGAGTSISRTGGGAGR
jgi:hypothetical protein